jgi:Uma2 family endonuclease
MKTPALRTPPHRLRRMTRVKYDRLVETGALDSGDRVELLDGLVVVREPQGSRHAVVVDLVIAALERALGEDYYVRGDKPLALDDVSEPEPDVAVVRGHPRDYLDAHPAAPVLIVEVADTSLADDRIRKGGLHARAGIADYWIVNLVDNVLEVYRRPERAPSGRSGWRYRGVRLFGRNAMIALLVAPRARIRVAALLP